MHATHHATWIYILTHNFLCNNYYVHSSETLRRSVVTEKNSYYFLKPLKKKTNVVSPSSKTCFDADIRITTYEVLS